MEVIPERGDIWWVALEPDVWFGDSQDTSLHRDISERAQRKAKNGDRCPTVELAEGQPADSDPDLM